MKPSGRLLWETLTRFDNSRDDLTTTSTKGRSAGAKITEPFLHLASEEQGGGWRNAILCMGYLQPSTSGRSSSAAQTASTDLMAAHASDLRSHAGEERAGTKHREALKTARAIKSFAARSS